MVTDIIKSEIEEALKSSGLHGVAILERTENSDLLEIAKPSEAEFFERLFDPGGQFWQVYRELRLGSKPQGKYMHLIGGRMYFCPQLTERYVYSIGMQKGYSFVGNRLVKRRRMDFDNIMLLLSAPFDTLKHASATIFTAFKTNESLKAFVDFSDKAKTLRGGEIGDPIKVAEDSLKNALECMRFSFLSSIAYSLKIKLAPSPAWSECELEKLASLLKFGNRKKAEDDFGFYSQNPYAISNKRFSEDPSRLEDISGLPVPQNPYVRWRENCKFLAGRYLAIRRGAYLRIGRESGLGELVFFLKTSELGDAKFRKQVAEERKKRFMGYSQMELPQRFILVNGALIGEAAVGDMQGQSVAGQSKMSGRAVFVNSKSDYTKKLDGGIIISRTLMPDLVELYDKVLGVVSESGGGLAHAAVIAREMNLPCIVQAKGIEAVKEGDLIEIDGKSGSIRKLQAA